MDNTVVKKALSYALGSDIHEVWRATRKRADGTFEPRIKKSTDEAWNASHGTDEVDIANCTFEQLPSNWQYENLEAARVAIEMVFDKTMSEEQISHEESEEMASTIHDEYLKRNVWAQSDPKLGVPFALLSQEEQDKDRAQLGPAQAKVQAYMDGKIDVEAICEQYGLPTSLRTK